MLSDRTKNEDRLDPPDNPHASGGIPKVVPPLPRVNPRAHDLPWRTAFSWLREGWDDLWKYPLPSLLYGVGVFVLSAVIVWALFTFRYEYALFPALAGFMVVGPMIASGLYEKSRMLDAGERPTFLRMVFVRPRSGYAAWIMGVMLLMLFVLWLRSAVMIWALFFGIAPFPGTDEIVSTLFFTPTGWALLLVGAGIGGLFAAFSFAISVFAVPMLLEEQTDALSALGISMATVWANLRVMIAWGAIVMFLFILAVATGFVGLIVIFPWLGHGTWRAYRALRPNERDKDESERMFITPA